MFAFLPLCLPWCPAQASWGKGYWTIFLDQECFTGDHLSVYVPIGVVSAVCLCALPPITSALLLWWRHGKLSESRTLHAYGILYSRYKCVDADMAPHVLGTPPPPQFLPHTYSHASTTLSTSTNASNLPGALMGHHWSFYTAACSGCVRWLEGADTLGVQGAEGNLRGTCTMETSAMIYGRPGATQHRTMPPTAATAAAA